MNHSFHATSCLSHNRPPCCHSNPLIGCGDCCPGADEGVVTEQERQRQRGRAGGSQESPSSMRGQRQKCSISRALSTKDFLRLLHMFTRRQKQTWTLCRVTWEGDFTRGGKATGKQRQTDVCGCEETVWQAENKMVFYQSAEGPSPPENCNGKEVATKLWSHFTISQ